MSDSLRKPFIELRDLILSARRAMHRNECTWEKLSETVDIVAAVLARMGIATNAAAPEGSLPWLIGEVLESRRRGEQMPISTKTVQMARIEGLCMGILGLSQEMMMRRHEEWLHPPTNARPPR